MPEASLLEYADAGSRRRFSRLALVAFLWSLLAPGLMLVVITVNIDRIDEIHPRSLLFAVLQTLVTAAPLAGVVMGGIAIGRVRARPEELRGLWLAIAAVVVGWVSTVGLAWLCGEASTWG
jgi:hypothetical protein